MDNLLRAAQVARLLGVHVRTLRRLRRRGLFPQPVRLGRMVRWPREDVEAYRRRLVEARQPNRR